MPHLQQEPSGHVCVCVCVCVCSMSDKLGFKKAFTALSALQVRGVLSL